MIEYKGAKWLKCDFHLHTPASHCFKDNKIVTAEQWVDKCIEQQLDCVAVTDHNTGAFIDQVKLAAQEKNLTVFPGVELTCDTSKIHILVLFDVDKTSQDVEDFIIKTGIERKDFASSEACSPKTCLEIIKLAHDNGALAIPAHIDEFNGLGLLSKKVIDDILSSDYINGVQFVYPEFANDKITVDDELCAKYNEKYGRENGAIGKENIKKYKLAVQEALKRNVSLLTFSDNPDEIQPSKHNLCGIGKAYTWLKMSQQPKLESIRQALLFPERVKNCFESKLVPYTEPSLWIKSIEVKNTRLTKNDECFHIDFNPQMNAIIGGRGSGKSSIFRFLRGVFHIAKDIEPLKGIKEEQNRFYQLENKETGVLKSDSLIVVEYVRDSILYKIDCLAARGDLKIFKFDNEKWIPIDDLNYMDFFVFEQYTQKQIFEIAKQPNSLKNLIDQGSKEIANLDDELSDLKAKYKNLKVSIQFGYEAQKKVGKIDTEIADLTIKINQYNASQISDIAKKQEKFIKYHQVFEDYLMKLRQSVATVSQQVEKVKGDCGILLDFSGLESQYKDELDAMVSSLNQDVEGKLSDVNKILQQIEDSISRVYREYQEKTLFEKDKNECTVLFTEKQKELEENGINDLTNYQKYVDLLRLKQNERRELDNHVLSLPSLEKDLIVLKNAIYARMQEKTNARMDIVKACSTNKVKIEVIPLSDKIIFIKAIRDIIQKQTGFDKGLQKIESLCFLQKPNFRTNYDSVLGDFYNIRNGQPSKLGFDGTFSNMIKSLTEDQISSLEVLVPGDTIDVKYKPNGSSNFKSIVNASAGQKTTAILTFILSKAGCPLLLDQPEDDLDNRLVCDLVVEKLKTIKEKRQVIVITHNANIPVIGDSEYIVTMDSSSRYLKEHSEGMVEDDAVRNDICEIMEGGEDAFMKRALRYEQLKH